MSQLGNLIKTIRGRLSQSEFAKKTGLSLRTISKLEAGGEPVRVQTVRRLMELLELPEEDRSALMLAWIKLELGNEAARYRVELQKPLRPFRDEDEILNRIRVRAAQLPINDQEQILLACERPEVLRCLRTLNALYDSLKKET